MKPKAPLYLALIHWPVYNQKREVVATSITPFDLHDIARTSKTYGIERYFVVCPVESQRLLAEKIMGHWLTGIGAEMNVTRKEAFELVQLAAQVEDACLTIKNETAKSPRLIATSAQNGPGRLSFSQVSQTLFESDDPHLLLFGTGWGMTEEILKKADLFLEPIAGLGEGAYNHLPVRAAVAIILDRLLSQR